MKTLVYTHEQLPQIVDQLYALLPTCKVMTFTGPLGAGKTTIIKQLLKKCNVAEPITSPTFTYVNVYENDQGQTFYHFDLYRIGSIDEFLEAGFDEYLYQPNSWAFIEWPEVIKPLLNQQTCNISIDYTAQELQRELTITLS